MESNKLLIGVQFNDERGVGIVMELIVLRDITLRQLLDGIQYGLKKKCKEGVYQICVNIYNDCLRTIDSAGNFPKLTLTSYNNALIFQKDQIGRLILKQEDLRKKLYEIGFITSTRIVFDCTQKYETYEVNTSNIIPAFNPNNKANTAIIFPEYNISTRQMYQFDHTPVEIIPPSDPPQKQSQNLFFVLLPTVMMVSSTMLIRGLLMNNGGIGMIALSASMSVATLTTSIVNYVRQHKTYKKNLKDWREHYQFYIAKTIAEIQQRKGLDVKKLCELYPDVNDILDSNNVNQSVYSMSAHIFSRVLEDPDFLSVR